MYVDVDAECLLEIMARLPSCRTVVFVELVGKLDLGYIVGWKKSNFMDHS